jgi:hypothetical protein
MWSNYKIIEAGGFKQRRETAVATHTFTIFQLFAHFFYIKQSFSRKCTI